MGTDGLRSHTTPARQAAATGVGVAPGPGTSRRSREFLGRPWFVETLLFFLIIWQEDLRLGWRTRGVTLPVSRALQDFYYFNFGNFANGYATAFLIDGLSDVIAASARGGIAASPPVRWARANPAGMAALASGLSSLIIVLAELRDSAFTTADLGDIPAGLLGAVVFLMVRSVRHRRHRLQPARP